MAMPVFTAAAHPIAPMLNALTPASSIDPKLRQVQPSPRASSSTILKHTSTEPTFASHMVDIHTTQIALEQKMRETGRQMEATRLESKRKVQQTVYVYAWMEVSF
jgi:uncharacterized protein (DUF305 family)